MRKLLLYIYMFLFSASLIADANINFLSTQLNPVEESKLMNDVILKDFHFTVNFEPSNNKELVDYLKKTDSVDLIGGTYGNFINLKNNALLYDVEDILVNIDANLLSEFKNITKLKTKKYYFIPWMQATYIMVANKKSLKYLPSGADINNLTYSEFIQWGKNLSNGTGSNKIGFPIGKNGLWHRFLQGYLYPSYTGNMYKNLNKEDTKLMWNELKKLWKYVNKSSFVYNKMDIPLLNEDIWVSWDHIARLTGVFKENKNDYITFPTPIGPKGRGYMLVLAGLGIPANKKVSNETNELIQYLLSDKIQILTTNSIGFFPVTKIKNAKKFDFQDLYKTILLQEQGKDSIMTLLPTNLGEKASDFDFTYKKAFSKIVLRNKNIDEIMAEQSIEIQNIIN